MNKYHHQRKLECVESSSASSHSDPSTRNKDSSHQMLESHLKEFKSQVLFTPSSLKELVESDEYQNEARTINRKGMEMIREGLIGQAIILLGEAQKILEYAASKGKQVNRNLIISVLHNLACSYQQSWGLQNCSNYIQALIYNLNSQLRLLTDSDNRLIQQATINRQLAQYYLLFCAINSQLKRNDAALIAAKKGNALLRTSSALLCKLAKSKNNIESNVLFILSSLANLRADTENMDSQQLIQIANFSLYTWNKKCTLATNSVGNKLKKFSIGNLMQIQPRDDTKIFQSSINSELEYQKVLEKAVIISMSFFTMATQLRLLAMNISNDDKQKARQLSQFRQSQCYHLIAIILILSFVPFDILFLQHILTSFSYHYIARLEPVPNKHETQTLLSSIVDRDEIKLGKQKSSFQTRSSFVERKENNQLETGVRASLKSQSQKYQTNRDIDKLNNYYYVRENKQALERESRKESKQNRMSHVSSKKQLLRRACATSKQSAQKTPIAYSPAQLSPRRNKPSKNSKSAASSKNSSIYKCISPRENKKSSHAIDQYFITQLYKDKKKNKNRSKSKKNKQTKYFLQKQHKDGQRKDKQNSSQLRSLKSASKLKSKLQQGKSKKKLSTINNYH